MHLYIVASALVLYTQNLIPATLDTCSAVDNLYLASCVHEQKAHGL